jgi:hypothetical protein
MGKHASEAVRGELPEAVQRRGPGQADPVGPGGAHGIAILGNTCNKDHTVHYGSPADRLTDSLIKWLNA